MGRSKNAARAAMNSLVAPQTAGGTNANQRQPTESWGGGQTGGPTTPSSDSNSSSAIGPVNANQTANNRGGNITIVPGLGTAVVFIVGALIMGVIGWKVLS